MAFGHSSGWPLGAVNNAAMGGSLRVAPGGPAFNSQVCSPGGAAGARGTPPDLRPGSSLSVGAHACYFLGFDSNHPHGRSLVQRLLNYRGHGGAEQEGTVRHPNEPG